MMGVYGNQMMEIWDSVSKIEFTFICSVPSCPLVNNLFLNYRQLLRSYGYLKGLVMVTISVVLRMGGIGIGT